MNYIVVDSSESVVCIGNMLSCENYMHQLYSVKKDSCNFIPYDVDHYMYEDYEVVYIKGTNIYLTKGQIKIMQNGCQEEYKSVNLIIQEANSIQHTYEFLSDELQSELELAKDIFEKIRKEQLKYVNSHLFDNLDIDALAREHERQREDNGFPTMYIPKLVQ